MRIIFIILMTSILINAKPATIDTVYNFFPGEGSIKGSEPEYYPRNIFGVPSTNAQRKIPENSPDQILSIGKSGEIIVGFKDKRVVDVEGADFTIFENAFETLDGSRIFAEPAEVSISQDGINFVKYDIDKNTLEYAAGKTPTNGKNNPFDPSVSGGDSYDISELGFSYITHIKIIDKTHLAANLPQGNIFYSPESILSGFDLDAVVAMEVTNNTTSITSENNITDYNRVEYYDLQGRRYYDIEKVRGYYIVLYYKDDELINIEKFYK